MRKASRAFTLIEILVVIVIIGVIVSAATLAVGVLGRDNQAEEEARRFWAVLRQAREEAELQTLDLGLFISGSAYEFLRFDSRQNIWVPITDDPFYRERTLPEGLRWRLWLDDREVVLKPDPPDRSKKDEHEKWPPQVSVLSSGEIMPFELHLERDDQPALWRVVALPDNDLRVEQRFDGVEREWSLVAQTKPPEDEEDEDEDDEEERLSNARR
ncbi:MAG TPA: type II secretion system minor pseudopilin GspH [Steroidobacter sp.]